MLKRLREWFRKSSHVHLREHRVNHMRDLIDLIDRFLDDALAYGLEWDDFISWKHDNPGIEAIRRRVAALEPMFFSKDEAVKKEAIVRLVQERNQVAALIGSEPRPAG